MLAASSDASDAAVAPLRLDEQIFLAQLVFRAVRLNDAFQAAAASLLLAHGTLSNAIELPPPSPNDFQLQRRKSSKSRLERQSSSDLSLQHLPSASDECTLSALDSRNSGAMLSAKLVTPVMTAYQGMSSRRSSLQPSGSFRGGKGSSSQPISSSAASAIFKCHFAEGDGDVEVHYAPIKTFARMLEKVEEYAKEGSVWPLSANILDPVRLSIVCSGPAQILQVAQWFIEAEPHYALQVCRVKNKFGVPEEALIGGYRDLMLSVVFTGADGLRIIGEIQIQDRTLHELKLKMHKLYKIQRSKDANIA